MAVEVKMPALSPTMEKGTLARWLVKVGDAVRSGALIAEIETDKATMELEATDDGNISRIIVAEGTEDVPVGTVIALLGDAEDALEENDAAAAPTAVMDLSAETSRSIVDPSIVAPDDQIDVDQASPLARRVAAATGKALGGIRGSGVRGRIMLADLAPPRSPSAPPEMVTPSVLEAAVASASRVPFESEKLSGMRRTIARRLTDAKQQIPHFYLTARCRLDPLLQLRADLNASLVDRTIRLSVNDLLIKAMAIAMIEVADVNVRFEGDELHRFRRVDIAMAVAVPGGLVTPVIEDAGSLSISAIARESQALAAKARAGGLSPEDYAGGTASISNLGMYGIDAIVPVINPPQAMILGIAAGIEQPWKVDGAVGLATIMATTASFDHRAIDGATGAQFMRAFRELVENPLRIVG